jgi:hypothetical protein
MVHRAERGNALLLSLIKITLPTEICKVEAGLGEEQKIRNYQGHGFARFSHQTDLDIKSDQFSFHLLRLEKARANRRTAQYS